MSAIQYIQVAVPSPLRQTFDYTLPKGCDASMVQPGTRVRVPFGNRHLTGIVVGLSATTDFPRQRIKAASAILDPAPLLASDLVDLYRWSADYYQYPLGQVLQTSLPAHIRKGQPAEEKQSRAYRLTAAGRDLGLATLSRAPRQREVIELLLASTTLTATQLNAAFDNPVSAIVKTLLDKGYIETCQPEAETPATNAPLYGEDGPLALNSEQDTALASIRAGQDRFAAYLLEGVTGSGKTEIYLQAIADMLAQDRQVLVMVPEISLTPQTVRRFARRFNREIAVFHSGLGDSERLTAWLRARNGKADIIIGTRSAIFTPLARPGLIIVDEEHDPSYKQQDGFRYSGRDLAIYRARQLDIPVVLGSATPSLESLNNALVGRYNYLQLTQRAGAANQPTFRLLDLKGQTLTDGFADALIQIIRSHLQQQNQVLVFLNRRGFAPIQLCRACGWIATCKRCDTSYTLHRQPPALICHHCESSRPVPTHCPECQGQELAVMGMGTEKTEETLQEQFPDFPVYRIDRDSTRSRERMQTVFDKVDSGAPCLLVGTQMLAKGHHFPNVTLVAVIDADAGLFSADFRGQEHMGQLLTQVAGRAGRGDKAGEVVIQTFNSTHPTLQALATSGYSPFARQLLDERRLGKLPPFTHMALVRAEAATRTLPAEFLAEIRRIAEASPAGARLLGPMPSPMEKRGGLFRLQLLVEADKRAVVQHCVATLIKTMEVHPHARKVRWSVDIDPVDFT